MTFRDYGERTFTLQHERLLNESASTGLIDGGVVSINSGDNTKVDISAGSGRIVDVSDPTAITQKLVSWTAKTAVTITDLATQPVTFLALDENGDVVEHPEFPENGTIRNEIIIGSAVHPNNTSIERVSNFTAVRPFQVSPALTDLTDAIGVINKSGNVVSGVTTTLSFARTAGRMHFGGIQRNPLDPDVISTPAASPASFTPVWRDGSGGFTFGATLQTLVSAGVYDNDAGGGTNAPTTSLNNNKWTNHYVYYSPDLDLHILEYGQSEYNNSTDAVVALSSESHESAPQLLEVPIVAAISMRGGATDLADLADAVVTQANKFGFF